ncbi:FG-GAP repeat domain-containing protein [Embleya sp. MST-111070]|uniref:FG-GAP repeat domain-containing protein n=1 Tax=Embleya sp. MST-111070 TaxID=3398231 RepID=UPI003F73C99D
MAMFRRKPTHDRRRRRPALVGGIAIAVLAGGLLTVSATPVSAAGGPTNLRMNPVPINGSTGTCGYVGAINPVSTLDLFATVGEANGPLIGARFELHEVGNGDQTTFDSGWVSESSGTHEAQAYIPATLLSDGKTYAWSVQSGRADAPDPDRAAGCTFTYDATAAAPPSVTSTDFPVNGGGKYAGQAGVFVFGTGSDTDVTAVEYSLNGTIPVGGAARAVYDAASGTWRTPPLTVAQWGANRLYAQTVDRAGNRSQQTTYTFSVPSDPNPPAPKPGDISGDGKIDVLSVDPTGALRFHSAGDDPAAGGRVASSNIHGPMTDYTWTGALVSHRGGGSRADNLYAFNGTGISMYRNTSNPDTGYFQRGQKSVVNRPSRCADPTQPDGKCVGYAPTWSRVGQLVAAGDVDGVATGGELGVFTNDLFTIEDDGAGNVRLLLFIGTVSSSSFDRAVAVGPATRQNQDIMVPGDVTGDGLPELWVRDRTNGNVYQYASVKKADGTADLDAYTATPTLIGTGFDTTAYPQVSTDGDFDGDGKADLWARTPNGNVHTFPGGNTPDATGNTFGPPQLIAGN